jgi:hypothetical protein
LADQFTRRGVNLALLGLALGLAAPGAPRPVTHTTLFDFAIAGGFHHGLKDRREGLHAGLHLILRAEPDNPHDADAVAVLAPDGARLGYIPREANAPVAALLRAGADVTCEVVDLLDIRRARDIPPDLVFTGFTSGDPRLRLTVAA